MPAQQGVRLDDEQCGPPATHEARQEHQRHTVSRRERGGRNLALQHAELLPQERILGHQRGLAHGHVGDRATHRRPRRGLRPPQETSMDGAENNVRALLQHAKDPGHHVIASRYCTHGPSGRGNVPDHPFPEHTGLAKAQHRGPDGDGSQHRRRAGKHCGKSSSPRHGPVCAPHPSPRNTAGAFTLITRGRWPCAP